MQFSSCCTWGRETSQGFSVGGGSISLEVAGVPSAAQEPSKALGLGVHWLGEDLVEKTCSCRAGARSRKTSV